MNYTKQCWSCGKVAMENKGDYYQCLNCDATWNELPKPTFPELESHSVLSSLTDGSMHRHPAFHPTKTVKKKAAKARASKGGKQ